MCFSSSDRSCVRCVCACVRLCVIFSHVVLPRNPSTCYAEVKNDNVQKILYWIWICVCVFKHLIKFKCFYTEIFLLLLFIKISLQIVLISFDLKEIENFETGKLSQMTLFKIDLDSLTY